MEESGRIPLLENHRTGSEWTAVAHIITGVIGSGVVSLPWSFAHLGFIVAPISILSFALTTLFTAFLLLSSSDSEEDHSSSSYVGAVKSTLGSKKANLCSILVHLTLYGYTIAYTITVGTTLVGYLTPAIISFGFLQLILSQIPDFHNIQSLSVVAAIMSLTYALLGLGLSIATVFSNGEAKGTIYGVKSKDKVWLVSQAIGDVAFSYPFSLILFEIRDTLRSPPPRSYTMKRASTTSIGVTTLFYLLCGGFGYAAFGMETPGNLMTAFNPHDRFTSLLLHLANACIVLHLVGGYQIYSQPLFASTENWLAEKLPESEFVTKNYSIKMPFGEMRVNLLRLCFRTAFVLSTTTIAVAFPYFNQVLGVLGSLNFWPMTIYFPVKMYLSYKNIQAWTTKWILLRLFSTVFLLIAGFALVGSIQGLLRAKLS